MGHRSGVPVRPRSLLGRWFWSLRNMNTPHVRGHDEGAVSLGLFAVTFDSGSEPSSSVPVIEHPTQSRLLDPSHE